MKKILISLMAIALVVGLVGAGTVAYFSDTESSTGNTFTAGILDLAAPIPTAQTGFSTATPSGTTTVSVSNIAPGNAGTGAVNLTNTGSTLSGLIDVKFGTITETAGTVGEFAGGTNLGAALELALYIDINQNRVWDSGDIGLKSDETTYAWATGVALDYAAATAYGGKIWNGIYTMAPTNADDFVIAWRVPATTVGNEIQGDSLTFDVTFQLRQSGAAGLS